MKHRSNHFSYYNINMNTVFNNTINFCNFKYFHKNLKNNFNLERNDLKKYLVDYKSKKIKQTSSSENKLWQDHKVYDLDE